MKKNLNYFLFILISSCFNRGDLKFDLIRDNLYSDKNGNLYVKSENNEDIDSVYVVWLETVICEECEFKKKNSFRYEEQLKNIVDVKSFQLDSVDNARGAEIYSDKNYTYVHKLMADGGVLIATQKNNSH